MDDRDLEARLSAYLHRRLDDARPPAELAQNVRQALATQPRGLNLGALGVRSPMRLGFSLTGAALAVIVLAVAGSNLGLHLGPAAGDHPSPSPTPITGPSQRFFIVLPPGTALPSKADSSAAGDVLTARLTALGVGNFVTATGYGITFTLPQGEPSDDDVRALLTAPGVVQFIPIPAGDPMVTAGETLPPSYPVLFGGDGVASVRDGTDQDGHPALDVTLAPAAARLFADYTTNHIGEQVAIVVDGQVASAPVIQSAIAGGHVQITNEGSATGFTLRPTLRAILVGGPLPASWRDATVPVTISRETATAAAVNSRDVTVQSADLQAIQQGERWQAIWSIVVAGSIPQPCVAAPSEPPHAVSCPPPASTELVLIDAVSGALVSSEAPAP